MPLSPHQHRDLITLLATHYVSEEEREALLWEAFASPPRSLYGDLSRTGTPRVFATNLVRALENHRKLPTGEHALAVLLEVVRPTVGAQDQAHLDEWIAALDTPAPHAHLADETDQALPVPPDASPPAWIEERAQQHAQRRLRFYLAVPLALLILILAGIWAWGWEVMEPVTFVAGACLAVGGYLYFALTLHEPSPAAFYERLREAERRKLLGASHLPPAQITSQAEAEDAYLSQLVQSKTLKQVTRYTALAGASERRLPREQVSIRPEFEYLRQVADERLAPSDLERRRYEDILSAMQEHRRAVLLGEPGAGKTTALTRLAEELYVRARHARRAPLPLFIPLGKWITAQPLQVFIAAQLGALGTYLTPLLASGRAALLLDGLNEVPVEQREEKARQIKTLLEEHPSLLVIVTCRQDDYKVDLGLDVLRIAPLDALRIRDFAGRYLGEAEGERLFWHLVGQAARPLYEELCGALTEETPRASRWQRWWRGGSPVNGPAPAEVQLWLEESLPERVRGQPEWRWRRWCYLRDDPASLLQLARNPYLLAMLVQVYNPQHDTLPANRGELFGQFTHMLLAREELGQVDALTRRVSLTAAGEALRGALARLALAMQTHRAARQEAGAVTALGLEEAVPRYLTPGQLAQARSTSLLEAGEVVRFSHQLLQEYFAACQMRKEMGDLQATALWPPERWWERTGWEEATILLAGLHSNDCTPVLEWVGEANPEVAALCLVRSGAAASDATRERLRARWLARLRDVVAEPEPRARAAVGRALALAELDNRPGVGLRADGLPDIAWVEIAGGKCQIGGDEVAYQGLPAQEAEVPTFWMAKYPVTYRQFQAFIDAPDGFYNDRWWEEAGKHPGEAGEQAFPYGSHPRERVSWYDAMAFCRWLSATVGYEVRLPSEEEWEKAARGTAGLLYPYGNEFDATKGNTMETGIGQTSAVGIFPEGASPYGVEEMSGNVWEWCLTNVSGHSRVLRGGSWCFNRQSARAASRVHHSPGYRDVDGGVRVVCVGPPR
ncbi:MAG: SUMF1/EgtB/PvdO family nonheme iron enzyme [Ardenticatenales bacterium]|nr:SUMF1/EgtB/PvdO family nonheme iron enzyme [Ardenticatenales bacterium]